MIALCCNPFGLDHHDDCEGRDGNDENQCGESGGKRNSVAARQLANRVRDARWTGANRLELQVAIKVRSKLIHCLVSPRGFLLQTLHHNPIKFILHLSYQLATRYSTT